MYAKMESQKDEVVIPVGLEKRHGQFIMIQMTTGLSSHP